MQFFVYLLRCSDGSFYCGWTNDIEKRVRAHNTGKASRYTKSRRPVKLAYFEKAKSKSGALKREYQIKQLTHKQKELLSKKDKKDCNLH